MRIGLLLGLWILLCAGPAFPAEPGPREAARNGIFVELGGNGILYSVNYDSRLTDHVTARVGVAAWHVDLFIVEARARLFPIMVNYLWGDGVNRVEFGLGLMPGVIGGGRGNSRSGSA